MEPLDLQSYYDKSRVDKSLWCISQQSVHTSTNNKQTTPPGPLNSPPELDSKCVQEQVQFKVLESHSSPLSVPQGCSLWVPSVAESWGNGASKVILP